MEPAVELTSIVKRFGAVIANDRVDLRVAPGEVHALLGENGAGKSTLMNVLFGLYQPDAGSIRIAGAPARIRSPADALRQGIGMVPQHSALIPDLSVVENVVLGRRGRWWLRLRDAAVDVARHADRYGWRLDPFARTGDLSPGDHQRIEIVKALYRGARILILDEPTSVLTPQQAEDLIATLRAFAAGGGSVVFISHKLAEVLRVSDRVTVMRDGRVVSTVVTADTSAPELARLMVGRDVTLPSAAAKAPPGAAVLEVAGLAAPGPTAASTLRGLSFAVRAGEVFGVAGVDGNGQSVLAGILCGRDPGEAGTVTLFGTPLRDYLRRPDRGAVAHVPADRRREGLVLDLSTGENLVLRDLVAGGGRLRPSALRERARALFARFGVRAAGIGQPVRFLSGGNQQRVVLAREAGGDPALLIAVQPTHGLDIAATRDVYDAIIRLRDAGAAIVYISTELDEILALSDRIGVMSGGRFAGILDRAGADPQTIGLLMGGGHG